jgi:hypothetical protein
MSSKFFEFFGIPISSILDRILICVVCVDHHHKSSILLDHAFFFFPSNNNTSLLFSLLPQTHTPTPKTTHTLLFIDTHIIHTHAYNQPATKTETVSFQKKIHRVSRVIERKRRERERERGKEKDHQIHY